VDILIREIIASPRPGHPAESQTILAHIAVSGFGPRQGDLDRHLVKRVQAEGQWAPETTADDYLDCLHAAARHPHAQLVLFEDRGGTIGAVIAPTRFVVPTRLLGRNLAPLVLVVYSADRGMIITGYQFTQFARIRVPDTAQWLR